ncbi:MAG: Rnase Y domain-containing protein, partial [candidate division NC10 bacterium]
MTTTLIWMLPVVAFFSFVLGFLVQKLIIERTIGAARAHAKRLAEEAERDAEARRRDAALEAKEIALKARTESEQETRQRQREIQEIERRVLQKEDQLGRRLEELDRRGKDVQGREQRATEVERSLKGKEERLDQLVEEQRRKLEVIAGLTAEEAKRQLLAQMEEDARREGALVAMRIEEEARETAHQKAKEVLATTIQRLAPDYTIEIAVSTLDLPSDDMKGRIIGREGRNIRALEQATGVDIIVDDTPEAILISAYDPLRREIARLALQRLIADGRIHPARIEEVVEKVKKEVDQTLREEGEKACMEVNVHGLHPELVRLVGRMKFRTSYGQNCLQHSKEVAWLAGMMAAEIKADAKLARRMGLLH